ncbi:MAG: class I SAM-dependent methyltransferase [Spirochaetaceae bacterium]|nr:class I SAM-dependent methyltransferase [Spirochaetaceae bacterium]
MRAQQTWSTPVRDEKVRSIPCALCGGRRFRPALHCEGFSYVKCCSCGLVQINPQPEQEAVHSRYGDDYLHYELSNEAAFFDLARRALDDADIANIEEQAAVQRNKRVLEIGCATGSVLAYLRDRGWLVHGVEISAPQANWAQRERGLDISTLPLEENHFPDEHFFLVTASHLIEHLNDPVSFVREVNRILVPGGFFLITTPNTSGLQARLFGSNWRSAIFDHLYLFSRNTLSRLVHEAGFTVEKTVTWGGIAQGFAPPALKTIVDRAAKRYGFGDVMLVRCRA